MRRRHAKPRKDGNPLEEEPEGTPAAPKVTIRDRDDFVTHLLGAHGDALSALKDIAGDILKLRRRAQIAEDRAEKAEKLAPGKDSVVLTGEEAKAYGLIKGKGLTLDKVPAELAKIPDLEKKAISGVRDKELIDAAGTRYKKDVLSTLLGDRPLRFKDVPQMKADKSGVEMVKGALVVTKDGDKEVETPLDEYIEKNHKDFKEVLLVKDQKKGDPPVKETPTGARMPRQTSTSTGTQGEPDTIKTVDRVLSNTFVTPSQRRAAAEKARSA